MAGDINGDAINDALAFDTSRQGLLNKWQRLTHNSKLPDLLMGIDNGVGGTTTVEYEVSTKLDNTVIDLLDIITNRITERRQQQDRNIKQEFVENEDTEKVGLLSPSKIHQIVPTRVDASNNWIEIGEGICGKKIESETKNELLFCLNKE